jgi:hypothetical protein
MTPVLFRLARYRPNRPLKALGHRGSGPHRQLRFWAVGLVRRVERRVRGACKTRFLGYCTSVSCFVLVGFGLGIALSGCMWVPCDGNFCIWRCMKAVRVYAECLFKSNVRSSGEERRTILHELLTQELRVGRLAIAASGVYDCRRADV